MPAPPANINVDVVESDANAPRMVRLAFGGVVLDFTPAIASTLGLALIQQSSFALERDRVAGVGAAAPPSRLIV
jgi:hypothetical protein